MTITLKQAVEIAKRELERQFPGFDVQLGNECNETQRGWYFDFQTVDDIAHFVSKEGKYERRFLGIPPKLDNDKVVKYDIDISQYL